VAKSGWGKVSENLDLEGCKVLHESKFLSENLVLWNPDKKFRIVFLFDRTKNALLKNITASLGQRLASGLSAVSAGGPVELAPNQGAAAK